MIEIEPVSDDLEAVLPVLRTLRAALPDPAFRDRLQVALAHGYRMLCARRNGVVLGYLGYRHIHDIFWGKTLFIDDLVVHPDARGQQIGSALLTHAKGLAQTASCDHIRLCSGLSRTDAHRFYDQNGFERVSVQFSYSLKQGQS